MGQNFIEYAVACNTDRAIPDATSGLKPVAKRILYGAFDEGYTYAKPHVKCANIVGNVMAYWHPHGDSSIYGALVRLAQPWVMRYPLIDFHGSMGNRDGDGPAAYRYTEARLSKLTEDGMLSGIKKKNIDFIPNYSETKDEPITLPSLFPNLLCNPNTGIGVALACNWLPHNLREVAQAINDYIDGKEPMLPGPDFPTGGIIINQKDIPEIIRTGHGSVKVRGKYTIEDGHNIVFSEIPYGVATEDLMTEIGTACDENRINGIKNLRNESNKNGFRLVIECDKNANLSVIITALFKETNLQTSISYNQVALVDKVPTELGLKDCIKIYVEHNKNCILKEIDFDLKKAHLRLETVLGLLKALEDIDNIINTIKKSASSVAAVSNLIAEYGFTEVQAKAIVDMKLGRLAGLEKIELQQERAELNDTIINLNAIAADPITELKKRLNKLVATYGDDRRTEITQIVETNKEEKEIQYVEPEKCVVIMTESGLIKRVPTASYRTQKKNGKGIKSTDDIVSTIIRTNTIDSLMVFTNMGTMYRLLVDNIPAGTNSTKGTPISSLITMEPGEKATTIYSIYRDTEAQYILFVSKSGLVKKTALDEYINTKKKNGVAAMKLREGDSIAAISLIKDEDVLLVSAGGQIIRFPTSSITPTGRATAGVKGMNLADDDYIIAAAAIRDKNDSLGIFLKNGTGKKVALTEFPAQNRGGKGLACHKINDISGSIVGIALINDEDSLLIAGSPSSICISASELTSGGRASIGSTVIKGSKILSVSKV